MRRTQEKFLAMQERVPALNCNVYRRKYNSNGLDQKLYER